MLIACKQSPGSRYRASQLQNTWELEFPSWMDETSLPEFPEWTMVSLILKFAILAEQIWPAKTAFAELAAATFAGWNKCRKFAVANSANWIACSQQQWEEGAQAQISYDQSDHSQNLKVHDTEKSWSPHDVTSEAADCMVQAWLWCWSLSRQETGPMAGGNLPSNNGKKSHKT